MGQGCLQVLQCSRPADPTNPKRVRLGSDQETRQAVWRGEMWYPYSQAKSKRFFSQAQKIFCMYPITSVNPSHAAIKILINATAAEFICKNIFPIPGQVKKL